MRVLTAIAVASVLFMASCGVMHFENGKRSGSGTTYSAWHHNGIYDLVEFSSPVTPNRFCGERDWKRFTTKHTVLTAIAGSIDEMLLFGVNVWSPQVVECECE